MIISNFELLTHYKLSRSEQEKRVKHLENALRELTQYHKVCKPLKRRTVFRLMVQYETLLEKFQ